MNIDPRAMQVINALSNVGGRPYIVGGFVRDMVMGLEPKDYDLEVYGLTVSDIRNALSAFKVDEVGARFGVFNVSVEGLEIQVVPPRRENKVAAGHKGFVVEFDPSISMLEAASRRDYTINSMALNPFNMEIYDPFGGQADIHQHWLRRTSEHFGEDPNRVLRGMQFASRFGMRVAPGTAALCSELANEYHTIPKEAIFAEWWKWATMSKIPAIGLDFLIKTNWFALYPEIKQMVFIPQNPEYHPEGGLWEHTRQAVDCAAYIGRREHLSPEDQGILVMATFLHDIGKISETEMRFGKIVSPGHDKAGEPLAEGFLYSIGFPFEKDGPSPLTQKIINLVGCHMRDLNPPSRKTTLRLADAVYPASIDMLLMLMEADHSSRPPLPGGLSANAEKIQEFSRELKVEEQPIPNILRGRDLITLGMKPGIQMGWLVNRAREAQLNEVFSDLKGAITWAEIQLSYPVFQDNSNYARSAEENECHQDQL